MIRLAPPTPTICTSPSKFATFQTFLAFLVDSTLTSTTRNFAMLGVLAIFALFGRSWGVELSLGKESTFEADCTIIDTVKKLSSRLWLSSESLNDEQLEVALTKARKKNRKLKMTKKAKERKRLVNVSQFSLPETESLEENETSAIQQELLYEQGKSLETNIANETTESANISGVVKNLSFVSTEVEEKVAFDTAFILENKTMSPLLLSNCEYVDLTILQEICGPGFAADFSSASKILHQTIFFDVGSGHTILGVHSEPRWQCCRRREDRTGGVGCRMGAACPASRANAI